MSSIIILDMRVGLRKLILLLGLIIFSGHCAGAEIQRPQWKDFCPKGLETAEYKEIQQFWPDGTKSTQAIYNYWAERRKEFERDLAKCDALGAGSNSSCYMLLKERQLFFNEQYQRDIQQKQISNQIWRDIHDKGSSPIMINIFSR